MSIELDVQKDLREWSRHALEKPRKFFNNLPACPYAKKAFEENKVGYVFKTEDDNLPLYQTMAGFDDSTLCRAAYRSSISTTSLALAYPWPRANRASVKRFLSVKSK